MMIRNCVIALVLGIGVLLAGCSEATFIPKPHGYMRFDFPEKAYDQYVSECPFSFPLSDEAIVVKAKNYSDQNCVLDLIYPEHKATLHITYRPVTDNLAQLTQSSHELAMEHTVRASSMDEIRYDLPEHKVHGVLYDIKGNVASNMQFHLTDSTSHFFRGSLYFATAPNADSLAPIVSYIRQDMDVLINGMEWKAAPEKE